MPEKLNAKIYGKLKLLRKKVFVKLAFTTIVWKELFL